MPHPPPTRVEPEDVAEQVAVVPHERHERPRQRVVRLPRRQQDRHLELPKRYDGRRPSATGPAPADSGHERAPSAPVRLRGVLAPVTAVDGQPGVD